MLKILGLEVEKLLGIIWPIFQTMPSLTAKGESDVGDPA
jgi:hypothetical protein